MKRLFTLLAIASCLIADAQTFVSTAPENKNIILEEFTGISCVYCPDGHKIGQQLHDANPNDVFLINIHTGSYANPQGPGTDFNTSFGSALASQTGLTGYPSGTVNRHVFSGSSTALSRTSWSSSASQLMSQPSPVNVGIQASVDMATSTLTVDVEVYYTGTQTVTSNKLNVAIVQNGILGPQTGGATYNPSAIDPATGLYTHNHMLRHMLTGQWGETVSDLTSGALYTNQYTWVMPNNISGVSLDPTNIAVVAFMTEGNQEILSGTEVYPNLVFANAYDANLTGSSATNIMCTPTTDLTVNFKNYGNINLTSLDIEYSINGGSVITYPWTGNLSSGASETVVIQNISVIPLISNSIDVTLVSPNGNTDQNTANNNLTCSFDGMYNAPTGQVTIEITTDGYPTETTWQFKENGAVIASGGPYSTTGAPQTPAYANISMGNCYTFVMLDSYGDGLLSPGSYKVKDVNGNVIVWGGTNSPNGNFASEESTYFEVNTSTSFIENNNNIISVYPNPVKDILNISGIFENVEIYDVFGKLVLSSTRSSIHTEELSDGMYFVNLITRNKIITKKITVVR